jgi:ubiquinone/menaquinone biosynthesis C-methylase UbiE
VSEPEGGPDIDPARWADIAATYDAVASTYAERFVNELEHKPFDRHLLGRFAQAVGPLSSPAHPVCDLGCGPGHIGAYLADLGLPVMGLDLSMAMVEQARRLWPALTFGQGDMTALPLDDSSLSAIACFYALIHIPRRLVPLALAEMQRVLIPGGILLLAAHGGSGTLHNEVMLDQPVPIDATLFGLSELGAFVADAGFDLIDAVQRDPYEEELATPRLYVWAVRRP